MGRGKYERTPEIREKISKTLKSKKIMPKERYIFPKGNQINKGKAPWNKGLKMWENKEHPRGMKGKKQSKRFLESLKKSKGKNHSNWRGDKVKYRGLHSWIAKNYGIPERCAFCGIDKLYGVDGRRLIQWANISGEYKRSISDWIPLCVKCHSNYDSKKLNKDLTIRS